MKVVESRGNVMNWRVEHTTKLIDNPQFASFVGHNLLHLDEVEMSDVWFEERVTWMLASRRARRERERSSNLDACGVCC